MSDSYDFWRDTYDNPTAYSKRLVEKIQQAKLREVRDWMRNAEQTPGNDTHTAWDELRCEFDKGGRFEVKDE
jgi:hypothetical protein